jgi:hypothetical protein
MTYFNGKSTREAMIRIKQQEGYERYDLLIEEQEKIGWDNLYSEGNSRNSGNYNKQHTQTEGNYGTQGCMQRSKERRKEKKNNTRKMTRARLQQE